MTAAEILIKIKSLFDSKGADAATQAIDKTGDAAKRSSTAQAAAGKAAKKLEGSFGKAAGVAGQLNQALSAGGPAAQKAGGAMRALGSIVSGLSGGLAGIATVILSVAITAFVKWRNSLEEVRRKATETAVEMARMRGEAERTRFDEAVKQHDRLTAAIDREASAYSKLSSARAEYDNAVKSVRMLEMEAAEKEDLARLAPDDEAGRAAVTARYAKARRGLEAEAEIADAERARADAERTERDAILRRDTAKEKLDDLDRELGSLRAMRQRLRLKEGEMDPEQFREAMYGESGYAARMADARTRRAAAAAEYEDASTDVEAAGWRRAAAEKKADAVGALRPRVNAAEDAAADAAATRTNDDAVHARIAVIEQLLIGSNEGFFRSVEAMYQNLVRAGQATDAKMKQLEQYVRDYAERNRQTL